MARSREKNQNYNMKTRRGSSSRKRGKDSMLTSSDATGAEFPNMTREELAATLGEILDNYMILNYTISKIILHPIINLLQKKMPLPSNTTNKVTPVFR